ncbi:MAG: hypothetical protein ACR2FN_07195 [Chitinophagaceae bacterium]
MKNKQGKLFQIIEILFVNLLIHTYSFSQSTNPAQTTTPATNNKADTNNLAPAKESQMTQPPANGMRVINNGQEALNNGQAAIQGVPIEDNKKASVPDKNQPANNSKDSLIKTPPQN